MMWNEQEKDILKRTIIFAKGAFAGKTDRNGKPYVTHGVRVAKFLGKGNDINVVLAAILHDVVEDTHYTFADLQREIQGLPDEVIDILRLVTRNPDDTYAQFIQKIVDSGNVKAILLKLADIRDNTNPKRKFGKTNEELKKYAGLMSRYEKAESLLFAALVKRV